MRIRHLRICSLLIGFLAAFGLATIVVPLLANPMKQNADAASGAGRIVTDDAPIYI